ncbi:unnamed protein product [Dovyalis caffra]|uniref:Rhamnogalacturonase A/B/Epimerase-like pectate lyase domain-containing protein n=1 Tax=Dovyalis caffra TaxID=77055 RepID=A0AAV1QQZ9_9ROSI|nr:unnamed protein product [Dovyalis caffra]
MAKLLRLHLLPFFIFLISSQINTSSAQNSYNVLSYGAKPDGKTDSSKAFLDAWTAACGSTGSSTVYVPAGTFSLGSVAFKGPNCISRDITVRIECTLVAPSDYRKLAGADSWLCFHLVNDAFNCCSQINTSSAQQSYNVLNYGAKPDGKTDSSKAFLDAWTAACGSTGSTNVDVPVGNYLLRPVSFEGSNCGSRNITVRIDGTLVAPSDYRILGGAESWLAFHQVNGVSIAGKGVLNAKGPSLWDCKAKGSNCPEGATSLKVMNSNNVRINGLTSIDSQMFHIVIHECQDVHVQDVKEPGVHNVTVKTTYFNGTENGFRIKSWAKPSTGFVQRVRFSGANINNVKNPIIIDEHYCPQSPCPEKGSGVKISDVAYIGIRGTSATPVAISLNCSSSNPCTGLKLQNVDLNYLKGRAQSSCANANGQAVGQVQPQGCL